jgi:hypothetical protein
VSAPSPTFVVRPRTPADDARPSWADLWRALAAELAASKEPDPGIAAALDAEQARLADVAADAGCILIPLDAPDSDDMT